MEIGNSVFISLKKTWFLEILSGLLRQGLQRKGCAGLCLMFVGRGSDRRKLPQHYKHSKGQTDL